MSCGKLAVFWVASLTNVTVTVIFLVNREFCVSLVGIVLKSDQKNGNYVELCINLQKKSNIFIKTLWSKIIFSRSKKIMIENFQNLKMSITIFEISKIPLYENLWSIRKFSKIPHPISKKYFSTIIFLWKSLIFSANLYTIPPSFHFLISFAIPAR